MIDRCVLYLFQPPTPDHVCTICYTSGTTGNPKGVMLTHGNIIANVSAVCAQMGEYAPREDDVMISFLPLAHMLERCCEVSSQCVAVDLLHASKPVSSCCSAITSHLPHAVWQNTSHDIIKTKVTWLKRRVICLTAYGIQLVFYLHTSKQMTIFKQFFIQGKNHNCRKYLFHHLGYLDTPLFR